MVREIANTSTARGKPSQHDAESGSRPGEGDQKRLSTASMPAASSSPLGQPAEFPAIVLRQRIHDRALVVAHVGGEAIELAVPTRAADDV